MTPTTTCTRRFQFCAGHRVYGHENKCGHLHGHNYVAYVTVQDQITGLDSIGRVVDFSVIKAEVGAWIDEHWDHGFLFNSDDEALAAALNDMRASDGTPQKWFMFVGMNPTAEVMADELMTTAQELLGPGLVVTEVTVWETENCYATVRAAAGKDGDEQ